MTTYPGHTFAALEEMTSATFLAMDVALRKAANWGELLTLPGDGTTDVTSTIQTAINTAGAVAMNGMKFQNSSGTFQAGLTAPGAGVVILPPGVHVVTTLTLAHRVQLRGCGRGTVLYQKAATSGPVIQNRRDGTAHSQYNVIADLTVHGNKANQTVANIGILLQGDASSDFTNVLDEDYDINCVIRDVYVLNTKGNGVSLVGAGANFLDNVKVRGADGVGVYSFQDNHLSNIDVGWSGLQGIHIAGESCTISNAKSWYSGQITAASGVGFYLTADSGAMSVCNAQDNKAAGFLWDGAFGWAASALISDSNSRGSAGTYPAFDIYGSNYNIIQGLARNRYNASYNGTTTVGEQASALRVQNTSVGNSVDLVAAVSVWGQSNTFIQSGSTIDGNTITINGVVQGTVQTPKTGAYTLLQSDSGDIVPINSASSVAVTVPVLATGSSIEIMRMGAGAVTLTASGTTLTGPTGAVLTPRVQGSFISLLWISTTDVRVSGDLS